MGSRVVSGTYVSGHNHSARSPKFYESLGLWKGTINVQLPRETDESVILPKERVPGLDPFDQNENQDFLIRPCRLKGVSGYQIVPIDKTTSAPRGHHSEKVIEIALTKEIEIKPDEELEVKLEGFDN
jgi:CTP-dependent riboflavin kinase